MPHWAQLPTAQDAVMRLVQQGVSEDEAKEKVNDKLNWTAGYVDGNGVRCVPYTGIQWPWEDFFAKTPPYKIEEVAGALKHLTVKPAHKDYPQRVLTQEEFAHFRSLVWYAYVHLGSPNFSELVKRAGSYIISLPVGPVAVPKISAGAITAGQFASGPISTNIAPKYFDGTLDGAEKISWGTDYTKPIGSAGEPYIDANGNVMVNVTLYDPYNPAVEYIAGKYAQPKTAGPVEYLEKDVAATLQMMKEHLLAMSANEDDGEHEDDDEQ